MAIQAGESSSQKKKGPDGPTVYTDKTGLANRFVQDFSSSNLTGL